MTDKAPTDPITIQNPSDLPGSPMSATIGFDQPCCFCGYNICSLALSGNCPECGALVNDAIRGSRIRYQPLAWIQRLKLGAQLACLGTLGLIFSIIAAAINAIIELTSMTWQAPDWLAWSLFAVFMLSVELVTFGMTMLSWSAPIRARRKRLRAAITRTSAMTIALAALILVLVQINGQNSLNTSTFEILITFIAGAVITLAIPLLYFFGLAQLSAVSGLIPWKKGQKRAFVLQIYAPSAFLVWIVIYALGTALIVAQMRQSSSTTSMLGIEWYFAVILISGLILLLIAIVMSAGLLLGLARQINTIAVEAIAAQLSAINNIQTNPSPGIDENIFAGGEAD